MLQLSTNPQETITSNIWETWQTAGYTTRPNSLTWIELNNLTGYFLKICTQKQLDYQSFDFKNILDKTLNYYENQSAIDEALGNPVENEEEYKKYMASIADQAEAEIKTSQQLTEQNQQLEKQNKKLKAKETETINTQQLKDEIKQINQNQAAILNKLEQLPHLAVQIEALKKSNKFKDLGNALSPVTIQPNKAASDPDIPKEPAHYTYHGVGAEFCQNCGSKLDAQAVKCWNCGAPIKESTKTLFQKIPEILKPKHKIRPLDAFAGAMIALVWLAVTYGALTNGAITWITITAIAFWWLLFVIVFRLVAGGLLD
jgi:DNA polymerase III alpha subunit (gram-positive type)